MNTAQYHLLTTPILSFQKNNMRNGGISLENKSKEAYLLNAHAYKEVSVNSLVKIMNLVCMGGFKMQENTWTWDEESGLLYCQHYAYVFVNLRYLGYYGTWIKHFMLHLFLFLFQYPVHYHSIKFFLNSGKCSLYFILVRSILLKPDKIIRQAHEFYLLPSCYNG